MRCFVEDANIELFYLDSFILYIIAPVNSIQAVVNSKIQSRQTGIPFERKTNIPNKNCLL